MPSISVKNASIINPLRYNPLKPTINKTGFHRYDGYDNDQVLTFVSGNATITPAITLSGGAPTPQWTVTESNGTVYSYTTAGFTHNRVVAGDMTIRLVNTGAIKSYVTQINFNGDGCKSTFAALQIQLFVNLTLLHLYTNQFTGDLSGVSWPAGLTSLYLSTNQFGGIVNISGCPAMRDFRYYTQTPVLNQATVDGVINNIWTARAGFTYASTIVCQIGGTNAAPTGTYQANCPTPASGKEQIYHLVNDPCTEGFKQWSFTYTA